ncbi:MAG TPA: CaiB/BaiF CoA-transferase family protein, partial [Caldimonas sp.]|nr:CaiB/BaiF CoA-transferase family protein [Caldimonas sp.]
DTRVRGLSSHFVWTNRGKESLALDLKHGAASVILGKLLAGADVLVQNLAPGAAARLGLSFEALHETHPRLVVCDISGYGDDADRPGPYRDRKAYDLLIQGESGFLSVTGTADEPAKAGCSIADIAAAMYAYSGILAALIERDRTGVGRRIDVSMLESMVEWMGFPLYYAHEGAPPPPRSGAAHATIYPYGPFPAGDGKSVLLGLQNEREWQVFCERVLGRPELARDPRFASNAARNAARHELRSIIVSAFAASTAAAVTERLEAARIASAQVRTMADVWAHPQLQARQRWVDVETPAGPVAALLPPGRRDAADAGMGAVPRLGEHTAALLAELGLAPTEIERLRGEGAIGEAIR